MAASRFSQTRYINDLPRARSSSPRAEEYATATSSSFDPARDAIHSTARLDDITSAQQPFNHLSQARQTFTYPPSISRQYDNDTQGSASMMSIELGRGAKRGAEDQDDDMSSNVVFDMGNDSLYEVTCTPPVRNRTPQKPSEALRRQASVRRAAESAKVRDVSNNKQRAPASNINNIELGGKATSAPRPRQTSVPSRFATNNTQPLKRAVNPPTTQSMQSYMLPDALPDLTELVSGTRKDGTPVFNRNSKSRSRFTAGPGNPPRPEHINFEGVPMPEEEKAIVISIEALKERVKQLEKDNAEAEKRAEEYEDHIIHLQTQLAAAQRRPTSALGSDDEPAGHDKLRRERTRLQANAKSLQTHLDRSERKVSVAEIAVKRMREERDKLVTQIGKAYFDFEEMKAENETFKEEAGRAQEENEGLRKEVDIVAEENRLLLLALTQAKNGNEAEKQTRPARESRTRMGSEKATQDAARKQQHATAQNAQPSRSAPNLELPKTRERSSRANVNLFEQAASHKPRKSSALTGSGQTSRPEGMHGPSHRRVTSAPIESEHSDADSTTQPDFARKAKSTANISVASGRLSKHAPSSREEDERDYTLLSALDPNDMIELRKKLEEEHRAGRLRPASGARPRAESIAAPPVPEVLRKSSMKDITVATGEDMTGNSNLDIVTKPTKSVRVQSPPTETLQSEQISTGDDSGMLSNISRRRRRAVSADGDPSAFIIPDITFHLQQRAAAVEVPPAHNAKSCTACPEGKTAQIPTPTPVTSRQEYDPDVTTATIRPSEPPAAALASVLKQLEDEIKHLKERLAIYNANYMRHDPAVHRSKRLQVKKTMDELTAEIEKRSNQVYSLYDVLEGQKMAAGDATATNSVPAASELDEVNETLQSLGMDAAEISGRIGRAAPKNVSAFGMGLDGTNEISEAGDEDLPWEGLSDFGEGSE